MAQDLIPVPDLDESREWEKKGRQGTDGRTSRSCVTDQALAGLADLRRGDEAELSQVRCGREMCALAAGDF